MKQLHFSITINAPVAKVWHTMLDDAPYREWTTAFSPGSHYAGSWEQGGKILFLGPGPDGKMGGMVARIAENRPHEFISIEHQGIVNDGVEDTTSEAVTGWAGAHENYTFTGVEGGTRLDIDIDVEESMLDAFQGMWPKALQKLKELAEQG